MTKSCKLRIISSILIMFVYGSSTQAQTGDWQAVRNLKPGTLISVKSRHLYPCYFQSVTEDQLVCKVPDHRLMRLPSEMAIPRGEICEVRLEVNQAKHGWIGAGIGAGVGAAIGASTSRTSRGANAVLGALGGALVGGVTGAIVPIFRHGKVIYRR